MGDPMNYQQFLTYSAEARVAALYPANVQGAWYDPSNLSTLFQDSAGTTPVTAVEQPVGRMLDKSGRGNHAVQSTTTKRPVLSRRVNLLTKTEQFGDAYWVIQNATISAVADAKFGTVNRLSSTGGRTCLIPTATLRTDAAQENSISWVVKAETAQRVLVLAGNSFLGADAQVDTPNINNTYIFDLSAGAFVSAPPSSLSAVSLGGGWYEITIRVASGSGLNQYFNGASLTLIDGTSNVMPAGAAVLVRSASCVRSTDAHLPYQRVNTATDYDADPAKFPAYLRFDGVDDALHTEDIDFTSTDKMVVWAGYSSESISTIQYLATNSVTTGRFTLIHQQSTSSQFESRGSAGSGYAGTTAIAGAHVLCGIGDISGNSSILRRGGVQVAQSAANQGAATYARALLSIGARGSGDLNLNGRLYSLIVRGAQTPLSQIEATELYIKQKMRMP